MGCHRLVVSSTRSDVRPDSLGEASDRVARAGGTYVVRVPHLDKPETKRGSRTEAISRMRRQLTELYVKLRVPYLLNNRRRVPTQRHDRVAMVGVYTQAPPSLTGFSFSPGGLLFPYHLGVATSLAYHKRITDETHLAVSAKAVNRRARRSMEDWILNLRYRYLSPCEQGRVGRSHRSRMPRLADAARTSPGGGDPNLRDLRREIRRQREGELVSPAEG